MSAITILLRTACRSPVGITAAVLLYYHLLETYPWVGQAINTVIRFFKRSDAVPAAVETKVPEVCQEYLPPPGLEEHLLTCVLGIVVIYSLFGTLANWFWQKWGKEKSMIFLRFLEDLGSQNRAIGFAKGLAKGKAIGRAEGKAEGETKLLDRQVREGIITPEQQAATEALLRAEAEAQNSAKSRE